MAGDPTQLDDTPTGRGRLHLGTGAGQFRQAPDVSAGDPYTRNLYRSAFIGTGE